MGEGVRFGSAVVPRIGETAPQLDDLTQTSKRICTCSWVKEHQPSGPRLRKLEVLKGCAPFSWDGTQS
jgi:hypothetical protein